MWSRSCYFHVLLLVTKITLVINNNVDDQRIVPENALFSDVIKNISRVNNVLQELIKNYERLQKIYKTESFETTDLSSDSEIDDLFRDAETRNRKKSKSNETRKEILLTTKKSFPATQMLVSEEDDDDEEKEEKIGDVMEKTFKSEDDEEETVDNVTEKTLKSDDEEEKKINNVKENTFNSDVEDKRLPLIEHLQSSIRNKTDRVITSSREESAESVVSTENVFEMKENDHRDHKHSDEIRIPDNVFFDNVIKNIQTTTLKIEKKHSKHRNKHHIEPMTVSEETKEVQTSDKDEDLLSTIKFSETFPTTKNYMQENTKKVKQIIHLETFNETNLWKDIADKKPINLKTFKNSHGFKRVMGLEKRHRFMKSNTDWDNPTLVILTKSKKKGETSKRTASSQSRSEEEEAEINKALIKTRMLRDAYGDACLKVVVKKCFKALKKVGKISCALYKCKSTTKDSFKENSKIGCINEFRPNSSKYKNGKTASEELMDDLRRAREVSLESCYPFMQPFTSAQNDTPALKTSNLQLNILRDTYERECQRASATRCHKACKYAYDTTCEKEICKKGLLKTYKKECKRQCKNAYVAKKSSKKSKKTSESESSSDETSSEESDASSSFSLGGSRDKDDKS